LVIDLAGIATLRHAITTTQALIAVGKTDIAMGDGVGRRDQLKTNGQSDQHENESKYFHHKIPLTLGAAKNVDATVIAGDFPVPGGLESTPPKLIPY